MQELCTRDQPIFSKSAERRVKDRLPIPTTCPHCSGAVKFASNAAVYGRTYGEWPWMYLCQNLSCRAYVGTHPHTNIPLGTLATAAIRDARKKAKDQFNALWQGGQMTRTAAYSWLAARMSIPVAACHFGWFDEAQCSRAMQVMTDASRAPVKSPYAAKAFSELRAMLEAKAARRA
ncbi:zinc-finger-containing protein [Burkholderia ubonensis]|uniref:zinc-finger-containing protein n=1 Tax=Burkholderia ubonensis TaxID=101571 RepID=UPI0009B2F5D2|nr:zinc-finger-containing protein [Burkholderia ubonensis]